MNTVSLGVQPCHLGQKKFLHESKCLHFHYEELRGPCHLKRTTLNITLNAIFRGLNFALRNGWAKLKIVEGSRRSGARECKECWAGVRHPLPSLWSTTHLLGAVSNGSGLWDLVLIIQTHRYNDNHGLLGISTWGYFGDFYIGYFCAMIQTGNLTFPSLLIKIWSNVNGELYFKSKYVSPNFSCKNHGFVTFEIRLVNSLYFSICKNEDI